MERTPGEEQHERWRLAVAVDGSEGSREALLVDGAAGVHHASRRRRDPCRGAPGVPGRLCAVGVRVHSGGLG